MRSSGGAFDRSRWRAAGATMLAFGIILGAMGAPLPALRLTLVPERPLGKAIPVTETHAAAGTRASAPFAARAGERGRMARLYFPKADGLAGGAEERARQLLAFEASALGIHATPDDLTLVALRASPSGTHARFQQRAHGWPVWGAEAVVSFDAAAAPTVLASDLDDARGADPKTPAIDLEEAIARARAAVAAPDPLPAPPAAMTWLRRRDTTFRLEHRVTFASESPPGDWEIWIDAADGTVRERRDRTVFAPLTVEGQARVFGIDPCLATGDPSLSDADDADSAVPMSAYEDVVLPDLDAASGGWYRLSGRWARLVDWEAPAGGADSALAPVFVHTRAAPGFEAAMVYTHIDAMQRWYRALGFTNANARRQVADAHGFGGADNSKFVPSLHKISFGEGGVDDAEDAEVIVHEYAHATQYDIVPTWGSGGHAGAMGEGFGDYLANSYAWSRYPARVEAWNGVFQWDGHNAFWAGRKSIDTALQYPRDATLPVHRAGTLWCSALTDALYGLRNRTVMDRLVLDHHYALTGAATMEDAANAILAADVALYSGAHLATLVETFGRWGLVDATAWTPVRIEHLPLDIATTAAGAPRIVARIVSTAAALDPHSVVVHEQRAGSPWSPTALDVQPDGTWTGTLAPSYGASEDLEYWIEARDAAGNTARLPATPGATFALSIGRVAESFESTDGGFTVGTASDAAVAGRWLRVVPVGTSAQPALDHTAAGTRCFVTGNAAPGAAAGDADVDGGATTLVSPVWDLRGASQATLSYWRWFSNDQGIVPDEDPWTVEVSNDAGASWTIVEHSTVSMPRWERVAIDLAARFGTLDRVQVRFVARDDNGSSIVEAAVDDVLLQVRDATDTAVDHRGGPAFRLDAEPNPARSDTRLRFALAQPSRVRLAVYDARGRLVRALLDTTLGTGRHAIAWDGRDAAGRPVANGVYAAALVSDAGALTHKLVVLR